MFNKQWKKQVDRKIFYVSVIAMVFLWKKSYGMKMECGENK